MVFGKKRSGGATTTIFYATDLHGSTICFKKFINAPAYYASKGKPVDVLIMGGDVAGKLIVPIIRENGRFKSYLTGMNYDMSDDAELAAFRKSCDTLGVYPWIFDADEYAAFSTDKAYQDRLFKELVLQRLGEWVEIADQRLAGQAFTCYLSPGNDDFAEVDEVLASSERIVVPDDKAVRIDDDHEMISTGAANITPFNCPRDIPEEELLRRLESLAAQVADMPRCVFNIHVPPRDSGLDNAPALDAQLRPQIGPQGVEMAAAGSTAVRTIITKCQPLLALHGHIHESMGVAKIGRTLCLNPGSVYSEGILRGVLVTVSRDQIETHMMTSG